MLAHSTPLADWVVVLPVLLALAGAALLVMLRAFLRVQPWIAAIVLLAILVSDGLLLQRVLATGPLSMTMGNWLPPFGISFTADAMGAGFAAIAAFVGFAVVLYLVGDAPERAAREGLYPLVLLLLAGVSGAFLTGDLFNLYVWFEVLLIASFGLIVLAGNPLQLDGAVKYGVLNVVATALFLAGLGLLYGLLGTLNMADIIGAARHAELAPLTAVAAVFALAFAMKAAAFPVNAWLPASYHPPPAAISALLGSLLTKIGVYAFLRLFIMLLPATRIVLASTIEVVAIATILLGPLSAIAETNPRRAVGFMLIGGIGIALLAVPGAQSAAVLGAIAYVFASMLTLAALYLAIGVAEKGSRGLVSGMVFVLLLATAGIPPFLGFWPKLLLLQGLIAGGDWVAVFALLLGSLLTLIAGLRLWSRLFWQQQPAAAVSPAIAPIVLLTGAVLLLGLWPSLMLDIASPAARDLLDPARYIAAVGLSP